jgi:hypothetical protein
MTREEFILLWCRNTGMTPEQIARQEYQPTPCDCGREGCHGWVMSRHGAPLPDPEEINPDRYVEDLEAVARAADALYPLLSQNLLEREAQIHEHALVLGEALAHVAYRMGLEGYARTPQRRRR